MSYEKDQFGSGGGGEGSVSVSSMIATAIAPYVTSASLATALGTYITSTSVATALGTYVTSASLATAVSGLLSSNSFSAAIATYVTSNSVSIGLATKQPKFSVADEGTTLSTVAGTVTTINFVGTGISASLTSGILTVTSAAGGGSGEGSVSVSTMISTALAGGYTGTASFTSITVGSKPIGAVLLGYQAISGVTSFGFSGSWSDYCVLRMTALFRAEAVGKTSITSSAAIYTDGGTTAFLSLATASNTMSSAQVVAIDFTVYGGDGQATKVLRVDGSKKTNIATIAVTATANTGFVNAIRYSTSATLTAGMAVLYGWRKA